MSANTTHRMIHHLRQAALGQDGAGLTDLELLEQYVTRRNEAAFEWLVRRHGPMVLGVCRRVLRNEADAEDAFQATFLVFVRKAGSIRSRGAVSSWLYGVAHNTALKAKAMNHKRHLKEREAGTVPKHFASADVWQELQALLDAELSRLPDKYRIPIMLCDLEGATIKEASRRLGWPLGTVNTRLTRGRARLATRMTKHGLTVSSCVVAAVVAQGAASANVPVALLETTTKAASLIAAAGHAAAVGVISAKVVALTEGMMRTMFLTKLKIVTPLVLAVALIGVGWGAYQTYAASASDASKGVDKSPPSRAAVLFAPPGEKEKSRADADQDDDKVDLPIGRPPIQVLAKLDNDGKLVVKTAIKTIRSNVPSSDSVAAGDGVDRGAGGEPAQLKGVATLRSQSYDLDSVQVLDTMGAKVNKKELAKLLKEEKVAMAIIAGEPVDLLHLRVLKDGTLTLVLPGSKASGDTTNPDVAPPGAFVPRPMPGPPADVLPPGLSLPQSIPGGPSSNPDRIPGAIPPGPGALQETAPPAPQSPKS